jgi:hypothetical protein
VSTSEATAKTHVRASDSTRNAHHSESHTNFDRRVAAQGGDSHACRYCRELPVLAKWADRMADHAKSDPKGLPAVMDEMARSDNRVQETHADWATLIARAADDVSRMVRSESHLLQISLSAALKAQIDYALAVFAMVIALAGQRADSELSNQHRVPIPEGIASVRKVIES